MRNLRGCFLAITTLLAACCFAEVRTVVIPLEIETGASCRWDASSATVLPSVLCTSADGQVIALAAEALARYHLEPSTYCPGGAFPRDAEASGGAYLSGASYASCQFRAREAGDYRLWCRVATPKGHSRFRDAVNGTIHYFDEETMEASPWHWSMRRKVSLKQGINHLAIIPYGYQFPDIDERVFAARVHSTTFTLRGNDEPDPLRRANMDATKPNGWRELAYEVVTPADLTRLAVYLHNVVSEKTAWFDDLRVDDLEPAPRSSDG